jgi:Zn-dependent protease
MVADRLGNRMLLGMDTAEFWLNAMLSLVVFILSLTVHEYAHARVAYALGDDTAARQGRMTLNPISHIDPIGTILLPILGNTGVPVIGWAKPVPVNPAQLTRRLTMRGGHALVAAAGPLSNLVLAVLCFALLAVVQRTGVLGRTGVSDSFEILASRLCVANLGLAVFNLLPVPPLDGSRLLPRSLDNVMEVLQRYSMFVFLGLILFGSRIVGVPVLFLATLLVELFGVSLRFR